MSGQGEAPAGGSESSTGERLVVTPARDGSWSWKYRRAGLELTSSSTYRTTRDAQRAAQAAYPELTVDVVGGPTRLGSSGRGRLRVLHGLSLIALIKRLVREASSLLGEERELAMFEMRDAARKAGIAAALLAVASIIGLLAAIVLTACIVIALSLVVPAWLAALIVGLAYAVVALGFAIGGIASARKAMPVMPRTTETVKETIGWAKHQMRSDGRSRSPVNG